MPSLHLRFKRKDTTVFMLCDTADSMRRIRTRLGEMLGVPIGNLRLYLNDKDHFLEDETIVSDHAKLSEGSVIAYCIGDEPLAVTIFTTT